jgi:hypothetical protein
MSHDLCDMSHDLCDLCDLSKDLPHDAKET